jgi:hypothetical protein
VSAAHDYDDLHRLIDRLTPDHARELHEHAMRLVGEEPSVIVPRDLSFIGLIQAEPDLAERSENIVREELGY